MVRRGFKKRVRWHRQTNSSYPSRKNPFALPRHLVTVTVQSFISPLFPFPPTVDDPPRAIAEAGLWASFPGEERERAQRGCESSHHMRFMGLGNTTMIFHLSLT